MWTSLRRLASRQGEESTRKRVIRFIETRSTAYRERVNADARII